MNIIRYFNLVVAFYLYPCRDRGSLEGGGCRKRDHGGYFWAWCCRLGCKFREHVRIQIWDWWLLYMSF